MAERSTWRPAGVAGQLAFDRKLATYLTASASAAALVASEANAIVVSSSAVEPFGINGDVSIDFNTDGQIDFQIDHDRINVNGADLDFLQLDKNDVTSPSNPYDFDFLASFPLNGTNVNGDHGYIAGDVGDQGFYPTALLLGDEIGPSKNFDFQETDNFRDNDQIIRANRLIDEDMGQVDAANPNPPAGKTPIVPGGTSGWIGLNGETRYLGVKIDLNDAGESGLNDPATNYWYGWIGVRIANEADATGEVVGYAYESQMNMPIEAGKLSPGLGGDYNGDNKVDAADYVVWRDNLGLMSGATPAQGDGTGDGRVSINDYNFWKARFGDSTASAAVFTAVPEPSTLLMGLLTGLAMIGALFMRRIRRSRKTA